MLNLGRELIFLHVHLRGEKRRASVASGRDNHGACFRHACGCRVLANSSTVVASSIDAGCFSFLKSKHRNSTRKWAGSSIKNANSTVQSTD